jgi:hypothetical protein
VGEDGKLEKYFGMLKRDKKTERNAYENME